MAACRAGSGRVDQGGHEGGMRPSRSRGNHCQMFVVHVVRQFHPGVGGLENVVLELASAQANAGNRVRVVTLDRLFDGAKRQKLPAIDTLNGIEIVRIPYFGSSRYPLALSVLRHIKKADLVHVHAIDFFFDFLAWTKPIHRRTLVVSTHGGFFHTTYAAWLKRLWFLTVTRLSMKFYAGVAAVSTFDFEQFRLVRPKGMVCIENGANVSKFYDASAGNFQKSIISIGRFAKNKRIDLLIEFAQALRRYDPEWKLTIAGRPGDLKVDDVIALVESTPAPAMESMSSLRPRMRQSKPSCETALSLQVRRTMRASAWQWSKECLPGCFPS